MAHRCGPRPVAVLAALAAACLLSGSHAANETEDNALAARLARADPKRGETVFLQCSVCHVARRGAAPTVGPNLWGVVGRRIAAQEEYAYSDALRGVSGEWDYATLDRYLLDPKNLAPQGSMAFAGVKADQERADLIAYLRTLSDHPVALPAASGDAPSGSTRPARNDWQGLPAGPGREEVFYLCGTCHSLMLVKQQGLSRESWDETLSRMVADQGMPRIESPEVRARVLDYLSEHFGAR